MNRAKLESRSWLAVIRTYQECTRRYSQLLAHYELTVPQLDVLSAINKHAPEATPKAIAEELVVTRGNITGVLNRLHERGLIETRQHATDGRSFVCELTDAGRSVFDRARAGARAFISEQLEIFDDSELELSMSHMQRMEAHLREMDPDAIAAAESVASYDHKLSGKTP